MFSLFFLLLPQLSLSSCSAVLAVFPMRVPKFHRSDIRGELYVANTYTKFAEQAGIDWVPLDLSSEARTSEILEKASGLLLPSGLEAYGDKEELAWYQAKVKLVAKIAISLNEKRFFPLFAIGFGAQLLLTELSQGTLTVTDISLPGLQYDVTWSKTPSPLLSLFPDLPLLSKVPQPFSLLHNFLADFALENPFFKAQGSLFANVTSTFSQGKALMAGFEIKNPPVLGFLFDVTRVQFFHDETYDIPKGKDSEDAAFSMAIGWLRVLKKGSCSFEYQEVLKERALWGWGALPGFTGEFDDFVYL